MQGVGEREWGRSLTERERQFASVHQLQHMVLNLRLCPDLHYIKSSSSASFVGTGR